MKRETELAINALLATDNTVSEQDAVKGLATMKGENLKRGACGDEILTPKEAADLLRVTTMTLYRWAQEGKFAVFVCRVVASAVGTPAIRALTLLRVAPRNQKVRYMMKKNKKTVSKLPDPDIIPVSGDKEAERLKAEVQNQYKSVLEGLKRLYTLCSQKTYLAAEIGQEDIGCLNYIVGKLSKIVGTAEMLTMEEMILAGEREPLIMSFWAGQVLAQRQIRRDEAEKNKRK